MKTVKKAPLESDFQDKFMRHVRRVRRCYVMKIRDTATVGIPDTLICCNGIMIAVELKRKMNLKEPATKLQLYTLKKIFRAGGVAMVVAPENFEEFMQLLRRIAEMPFAFNPPRPFWLAT